MVFVGYIPWVYTVRGYTQVSLEFFRDTTKPRGASQNYQVHPRMIPIRYTGRCLFFANQKGNTKKCDSMPLKCVKIKPLDSRIVVVV